MLWIFKIIDLKLYLYNILKNHFFKLKTYSLLMAKFFTFCNIFFFFLPFFIVAQTQNRPLGANYKAMGNVGVIKSDLWSVFHNQAGLADVQTMAIGANFENKYGIKELNYSALAFALPTKNGTFGLSYSYFGYPKYYENKVGLAFGKKLWQKVSAGIQLDYFNTKIYEQYGSGGLFTAEIGIQIEPVENFFVGAHAFNPLRISYNTYNQEALPSALKLGIGYLFSEKVLFAVEVESSFDEGTNFKSGLEYQAVDKFFLRVGINTNPATYHFGLGYQFQVLLADLAFSHHQVLGYSTNISLRYLFKKH